MRDLDEKNALEAKLIKKMARTSIQYGVLEDKDRILVAVSGGKDSYCLLYLLDKLRQRLPFRIDIIACHVSQGQPGFDPTPLVRWLEQSGVAFEIAAQDTYQVVQRNIQPGQTACSICSRMRRGILYTTARRLGCNKLALGHHREDTLATLLMNLFYTGKIQAMPAKYTVDEGDLQVIRPMIEVMEADLITLSEAWDFPIVPCVLCSGQADHRRKFVAGLMNDLEKDHPDLKNIMLGAIKNVRPTHLLDPSIHKIPTAP